MINNSSLVLVTALLVPIGQVALAQGDDGSSQGTEQSNDSGEGDTTTWGIHGGDIYQFDTGIHDGGSFSVNRVFLGGGIDYKFTPSLSLNFDIGFEIDSYDFKGSGPFTNAANGVPWTTTMDVTLKVLGRWKVDDQWRVFLGGLVSWSGETTAKATDSFTGGGLMGFAYTFSDELTLGAGMQISTRIEDGLLFIPSPIIDWRITEQLFISNVRSPVTFPASLGVEIIYYLSREVNISLGTRYEYRRFRLNDDGPLNIQNGVGLDSGFPLWVRFEWRPVPQIRLHLVAGVELGEKLKLYDQDGNGIVDEGVDPAPFVGFFLGFEF
jgi:hypothetical protein